MNVYTVRPDGLHYRRVISEMGWRFETPFLSRLPVGTSEPLLFRMQSLDEDMVEEQGQFDIGDGGDVALAQTRFRNGIADCVYKIGFTPGLVLSHAAKHSLGDILDVTGRVMDLQVDTTRMYLYICTQFNDKIIDIQNTDIRHVAKYRPSQFTKLMLHSEEVKTETLFRVDWPPESKSQVPTGEVVYPPIDTFATDAFVDRVKSANLSGFIFRKI
jgi:hypothetical protein